MADKKSPGIRFDYQPEGQEKELLERVYKRKKQMEDSPFRQAALEQAKKGREQWEAMRSPKGEDEWQSNHYVPMTTAVVETVLSECIDQAIKPIIGPRGVEDKPRAMVMSNLFAYSWEVGDGDMAVYDIWKDAFITGTGIGQEYYWRDIRKVKTSKNKSGKWEEKTIFNYDDCYLEAVRLEDFFVDEKARGFSGPFAARDCIRRYILDIESFKLFFDNDTWNELGNVKYVKAGGDTNYYEFYSPPDGIDKSKDVEVLWYWATKPDDWLVIVANDVVVYMGPNPYKHKQLPFARAIDVKRPHNFYGKGEPELLESIQDELNVLRRMTIDRNHLDIDKMFFVSNRLGLSDEDLVARPHGMIPTDDVNSAKAVEYNDVPRSVEISLKHLEDDGTIATGVNPRQQSLPTNGTATEAAILKESTLKRIRLKIRLFEREFLTHIARMRVANIIQYYSQPKLEKIIGQSGTEEFKAQVDELRAKGIETVTIGQETFQKNYRQIRLEDKELNFDPEGNPVEKPAKGFTFFEAKPDYFVPVARGGFDIKIAAGSTLPISEPLMQTKTAEMYDRLIQIAIGIPNTYDPVKLGDALLRVNKFTPEEFHATSPQESDDTARVSMLVDLASTENELMMSGQVVPPTPFSSPVHTRMHVSFTRSPQFQELDKTDPRIQNFIDHISGEILAQHQRAGSQNPQMMQGQGNGGLPARNQAPSEQPPPVSQTIPAVISGGGQAPVAI